ncbi:MAG: electron transfer flavoprotein subunit alpha [Planctomycetaceae bacterium]|nr:electron transfer flavoprotein subunit alpha [Planctomycetaceae bacterium]
MHILVVAEHDGHRLRPGCLTALGCANSLVRDPDDRVECLVLGHHIDNVAEDAARFVPVLSADGPSLHNPVADRYARQIADVVVTSAADVLLAASSTFARDIVSRAAGLLGGAMASDVTAVQYDGDRLVLQRPMFAGAVTARILLHGQPQIITVRPTAFEPADEAGAACPITPVAVRDEALPNGITFERLDSRSSHRPDVTEARIVVSGGRGIRSADDFENLVGGVADCLEGATGSSRALVDAGITPNELQVGQTGKVVAPELYIAMGISGAVQHLAGMKNSRVIVAINTDPDAPIFEVADYGLVGDAYEVAPQLIDRLHAS